MDKDKKIKGLNELVSANHDAAARFNDASSLVIDVDLRKYLQVCMADREKYCKDLGHLLIDLDVPHNPTGTTIGSIERTWMTVKGRIVEETEEMVLRAMIERDSELEASYSKWLADSWTADERLVMAKHLAGIQAVTRQLHDWQVIIADTNLRS